MHGGLGELGVARQTRLLTLKAEAYGRRMPADVPTILATSSGIAMGRRTRFAFTALTNFAVDLSGVTGRSPRICLLATAMGDDKAVLHYLTEAAQDSGFTPSHAGCYVRV